MIDFNIYYLRSYERFTTRRLLDFVKPGGIFVDVGANIGYFTLRAARRVGPTGRVYAFEPMQRAYDRLVQHVSLNGLSNVKTERLVVTSRSSGRQSVSFRNSWKLFDAPAVDDEPEQVDTTSLDDYVVRAGVSRLDMMKVDVDGYECRVISGAKETLRRFRPVLILEMGKYTTRAVGDSINDVIDVLQSIGYTFHSEATLLAYRSTAQLLDAIPDAGTINVICRCHG